MISSLPSLIPNVAALVAYLDPGSGSLFAQGVIAVMAGLAVGVSCFWAKLKAFVGKFLNKSKSKD